VGGAEGALPIAMGTGAGFAGGKIGRLFDIAAMESSRGAMQPRLQHPREQELRGGLRRIGSRRQGVRTGARVEPPAVNGPTSERPALGVGRLGAGLLVGSVTAGRSVTPTDK
jgi:hypothetical protein